MILTQHIPDFICCHYREDAKHSSAAKSWSVLHEMNQFTLFLRNHNEFAASLQPQNQLRPVRPAGHLYVPWCTYQVVTRCLGRRDWGTLQRIVQMIWPRIVLCWPRSCVCCWHRCGHLTRHYSPTSQSTVTAAASCSPETTTMRERL